MKLDTSTINMLLTGVLASVLSAVITSLINIFYQRRAEKKQLSDTLMQLNTFLVNEPFLENDASLNKYMTNDDKENQLKKDRYNMYCLMKYNYLEDFCRYHKFKSKKINKILNMSEYVNDNIEWWNENKKINYKSYNKKFLHLVEEIIYDS